LRKLSKSRFPNLEFYELRKKGVMNFKVKNLHTKSQSTIRCISNLDDISVLESHVNPSLMEEFSLESDEEVSKKRFIKHQLSSAFVIEALRHILGSSDAKYVVIMNGRTLHERITVEITSENSKTAIALDNNVYLSRIQYFIESVLNLGYIKSVIEENWRQVSENRELISSCHDYFTRRVKDKNLNPFLHLYSSQSKLLQESQSRESGDSTRKFLFLTSSNDEMLQIQKFLGFDAVDQLEILRRFYQLNIEDLKNGSLELTVRVHPNIRNKSKDIRGRYRDLNEFQLAKVYNYWSEINSYELLTSADCVFTTVSSMGCDAAYLKIPSFSFVPSMYTVLGITNEINLNELAIPNLRYFEYDSYHLQSLKFANFQVNFGLEFKYFSPANLEFKYQEVSTIFSPAQPLFNFVSRIFEFQKS